MQEKAQPQYFIEIKDLLIVHFLEVRIMSCTIFFYSQEYHLLTN